MSKVGEFLAVRDAWYNGGDDPVPERDAFTEFCDENSDLILRALRRDELVENPSCALLDDLRRALKCETHTEPHAALAAIREYVR